MTMPIRVDSPRRRAAAVFGVALQRAMLRRQVGQHPLADAAHVARSAVVQWRHGRNLPTMATARRLAEALDDEHLLDIVREARTANCERCGKEFLHEGAGPKRYCSETCLILGQKIRQALAAPKGKVRASQLKVLQIERATDHAALAEHMASVALMCRSCEPAGLCRQPECPLRPVSPLSLELAPGRHVTSAVKPEGTWGPSHREAMLVRIRAADAERWARPGEREAHRERMLKRHRNQTEQERQDWIGKIKKTKAERRKAS